MISTFLYLCIVLLSATAESAANKHPASLSAGGYWVSNPGCPQGSWYNTGAGDSIRCHCWSYCGYICEDRPTTTTPKASTSTNSTTTTTPTPDESPECEQGSLFMIPGTSMVCKCPRNHEEPGYSCQEVSFDRR